MDWIEQLETSLDYIEANLENSIDVNRLGQITCTTGYHYQRMFSYISGITLSEYIRRRRMTVACLDLKHGVKVIDVAQKYGYNSPDAFTKAFKKLIGILPSEVSQAGISLKSYPRIHFSLTIKGAVEMDYRIEEKGMFRVIGQKISLTDEIEQNFIEVPKFWDELTTSGTLETILSKMRSDSPGVLGITTGYKNELTKQLDYYIAVESDGELEDNLISFEVPACTWAIFKGNGPMPDAIQELEVRIGTEWLPSSGYQYGKGPDIERYLVPNPQDAEFEVWIPIEKKESTL